MPRRATHAAVVFDGVKPVVEWILNLSFDQPAANPNGIVVDKSDHPWVAEFGTNKIATIDTAAMRIQELTIPQSGARPRRLGLTSDGKIWYVDFARGRLGRFTPSSGEFREWLMPGGSSSQPYGMAVDDRDRIWFVQTGTNPNRFVGFDPAAEDFFSNTPIPSGAGSVRHMYFHPPSREIWFGTDANTIGRARL